VGSGQSTERHRRHRIARQVKRAWGGRTRWQALTALAPATRPRFGMPESFFSFCGERVGDSSTVEQRTLTPSILVRIQVPQPYHLLILLRFVSFRWRRNSSDM